MASLTLLRRPHGLVALALVVTLSLQYLTSTTEIDGGNTHLRVLETTEKAWQLDGAEEAHHFERFLLERHISATALEIEQIPEFTNNFREAAAAGRLEEAPTPTETEHQASRAPPEIQPYTLEDALEESKIWERAFSILIYDPERDIFIGHYNRKFDWRACNMKLFHSLRNLSLILRKLFPDRFCGADCDEFVIPVGSGDYPHVNVKGLPYITGKAPTLMFGSAFRDTSLYPNMIAMPMPVPLHLFCFGEWALNGGTKLCPEFKGKKTGQELMLGDHGLEWKDLTPQVVSRTTDFTYLPSLQDRFKGEKGWYKAEDKPQPLNFVQEGEQTPEKRAAAIQALNEEYDSLVPRWKAVALTAQAELDAGEDELPWANMKLSRFCKGAQLMPTVGSDEYSLWESVGIATGEAMWVDELATYKYHIDLAGGGGTTWTGTIDKLAMPGLLFHHVSPTKDYIHDLLKPWKHYIPVRPDLKDLKAKFEWAEAHPTQARIISETGTAFMRNLGTLEGFGQVFDEVMAEPLRRIVEAYQPVSKTHPEMSSWRELFDSIEGNMEEPVIECTGLDYKSKCKMVDNPSVLNWSTIGVFVAM